MKVLIIAYYWPPSGGSGVQRWLKFVKYLPSFGITPYVFTPENPSFSLRDESLLKDVPAEAEVVRFPIWEPFGGVNKVQGGESKPKSLIKKLTTWLRGNLVYPDPRIFWVKPSVQFLEGFLKDNEIGIVITTGPPHSVHLIGQQLKKKNPNLKWLADFRDPWSEWGVLLSFSLSSWAKRIHKKMEKNVLTSADRVLTITPFYVKQLERLSGRKVDLITNGFDETDFAGLQIQSTEKFVIRHVGLVNPTCDPRPFMKAVEGLIQENASLANQLEIIFTGQVNEDFIRFVKGNEKLARITVFQSSVPHHELIQLYGRSSALLLILTGYKDGEGFLPGKLFEYIATGLPIMAVGPVPSDADSLLKDSDIGQVVPSENPSGIKSLVLENYENWKSGKKNIKSVKAPRYSRKELTFKLAEILKSI
jgi:glycosyltransferase involved in cell wall biosynthesis